MHEKSHGNVDTGDDTDLDGKLLEEISYITLHEKSEEEKWSEFVVEMSMNKIVKKISEENLNDSWTSLTEIIAGKPLSKSLLSKCFEVELLLRLLLKNAIEKTEYLPLTALLMKIISVHYPIEFKYYLPLVSEGMCQTYIALPSSTEYLNAHGRSFCKVLAYLFTMPREKDSLLFNVVLTIIRKYGHQWTCAEEVNLVDELQEYRLCVDATAATCLVCEITKRRSPDDDEIGTEIEKFTSLINQSTLNAEISASIRKIYLDGIMKIEESSAGNDREIQSFPSFLSLSGTDGFKSISENKVIPSSPTNSSAISKVSLVPQEPSKSKPPSKKPPKSKSQGQTHKSHNNRHFSTENGSVAPGILGKGPGVRNNRAQHNANNRTNATEDVTAVANDCHLIMTDARMMQDSELLKNLLARFDFNPREYNMDLKDARLFVIKSNSEDDIFRSVKYSCWTSTKPGNEKLNAAFKEQQRKGNKAPIYLIFSVNGSGHFCGVAEMKSEVDVNIDTGIWVQDKWKGRFDVRWIYIKDIPNNSLYHILLKNSENKPVTRSRDTQEVLVETADHMLKIIHNYNSKTSIFDDFDHYEIREEEDARTRAVTNVLHR